MTKKELGKVGEELAIKFLKKSGFEILHTNWKSHPYEIDIIAKQNDITVFVEVKARLGDYFGNPEEAVGRAKINNIKSAAEIYLEAHDTKKCRIDVIAISLQKSDEPNIVHFEDVF